MRFIPALAGNMSPWVLAFCCTKVHPRARGEHRDAVFSPGSKAGSSPRSRGTFDQAANYLTKYRFIPALAGNIATFIAA